VRLLGSLFDAAGDFALNGFESERARFEQNFKRLEEHLKTVELCQEGEEPDHDSWSRFG